MVFDKVSALGLKHVTIILSASSFYIVFDFLLKILYNIKWMNVMLE